MDGWIGMLALRAAPVATLVMIARSGHAQDSSRAQALFDEGRRLMADGNYAAACPKLAASQRLDPGAGTLMNLASCYEKNAQLASAWATFKEAAAAARSSGHPDWEMAARNRATQLEPQLSHLTVTVLSDSDLTGLVVTRDGRELDRAEWGMPLPIDSGDHQIEASAPRRKKWSTSVLVAASTSQVSVTVPQLVEEASEVAAPPLPERSGPDTGATWRGIGLGTAGVGVIGVGLGAVFGLLAKSTRDEALSHCTADRACDAEGVRLGEAADAKATVSTVAFVGGGVLMLTGAVLYLTAPRASSVGTRKSVWLAPSPSLRGAGASLDLGGVF